MYVLVGLINYSLCFVIWNNLEKFCFFMMIKHKRAEENVRKRSWTRSEIEFYCIQTKNHSHETDWGLVKHCKRAFLAAPPFVSISSKFLNFGACIQNKEEKLKQVNHGKLFLAGEKWMLVWLVVVVFLRLHLFIKEKMSNSVASMLTPLTERVHTLGREELLCGSRCVRWGD